MHINLLKHKTKYLSSGEVVHTFDTPYNRIEHSDRIHHISDTLLQIRTDGRVKNPLLFCDLII